MRNTNYTYYLKQTVLQRSFKKQINNKWQKSAAYWFIPGRINILMLVMESEVTLICIALQFLNVQHKKCIKMLK